jgi:long-chain fatty acid transport protein
VQAGFAYKLTPQWTVLGEFDFFTWSNFKAIDIHTNSPSLGNLVTNENYRDTFGLAVGAEYQLNDQWRLRTGFKYDETPTVDAFRDTRVPDGDRFEIAGGFHYQYDEHIGIDASYAHLFFIDSSVNVQRQFFTTVPAILTTADINAESSVSVDILSVGLSYKF